MPLPRVDTNPDTGDRRQRDWRVLMGLGIPTWYHYRYKYSDFAVAGTDALVTPDELGPAQIILLCKVKHEVAFAGGAISAYTIEVGIAGDTTKYHAAFDVFQAVGPTVYNIDDTVQSESHTANAPWIVTARSTGANLDQATAGIVDIAMLITSPPNTT